MLLISWLREVCRGRVNVHSSRSPRPVQTTRSFADVQILESRRLLTDLTATVTNAGLLVVTDPSNAATNVVTLQYHLTAGQTPTMDFFLTGSGSTTINGLADYDVTANLASFSAITVLTQNNNDTVRIDTTNQGFSNISGGITLSGSGSSTQGFVSATGNNTYVFVSTNLIGSVVVDDLTGSSAQDKLDFSTSSDVQLDLSTTSIQQVNKGNTNLNLSLTSNTVLSNINVIGGTATNTLTGGSGNDILDASSSSGANTLTAGSSGNDQLKGGSGTNTYKFGDAVGISLDTVVPGKGINNLDFSQVTSSTAAPQQVNLATSGGVTDPTDTLWLASATRRRVYVANGSDANAFQLVIGSNTAGGANRLTAGANPHLILDVSGSSGTNTLTAGNSGIEELKGGSGSNTYRFGDAVGISLNAIMPGKGANILDFSNVTSSTAVPLQVNLATPGGANDPADNLWLASATSRRVYVFNGIDTNAFQLVIGSNSPGGANQLTGGTGPNVTLDVAGSPGTNTLTAGRAGNELLKGGSGTNTYRFGDAAGISLDTIMPGRGANILNFSNVTSAPGTPLQVNLATSGGMNDPADNLWLASITNRRVYVANSNAANAFQLVIGSTNVGGANQLTAGAAPNVTLDVSGSSGTNTLTAGNAGNEVLKGGSGANTYTFGDAVGISLNTIVPGTGGNTLNFSSVTTSVAAPLQVNLATAGGVTDPTDTLWLASATNRRVYVNNGNDTNAFQLVIGSANAGGANQLKGGVGPDVTLDVSTSSGTNTLTAGNFGNEVLRGGLGATTYKFGDAIGISLNAIVPGTGPNTLDFSNVNSSIGAPVQVNLTTSGGVNDPADTLWLASATNRRVYVFNGIDTNSFQRVYGSINAGGENRLTAGAGSNVTLDASGYAAINILTAGSGNDILIGGAGNNEFTTGKGIVQMNGAKGDANTFVCLDHASSVIVTPSGTGYNALDFRYVTSTLAVNLKASQIIATYGTTIVSTSGTNQGSLFQAVLRP